MEYDLYQIVLLTRPGCINVSSSCYNDTQLYQCVAIKYLSNLIRGSIMNTKGPWKIYFLSPRVKTGGRWYVVGISHITLCNGSQLYWVSMNSHNVLCEESNACIWSENSELERLFLNMMTSLNQALIMKINLLQMHKPSFFQYKRCHLSEVVGC